MEVIGVTVVPFSPHFGNWQGMKIKMLTERNMLQGGSKERLRETVVFLWRAALQSELGPALMNIFGSYTDEAQSFGKSGFLGVAARAAVCSQNQGWAIQNQSELKQVKINRCALVQGRKPSLRMSKPSLQKQDESLQTIYHLSGKGSLSNSRLICKKGSWELGSNLKNASCQVWKWNCGS